MPELLSLVKHAKAVPFEVRQAQDTKRLMDAAQDTTSKLITGEIQPITTPINSVPDLQTLMDMRFIQACMSDPAHRAKMEALQMFEADGCEEAKSLMQKWVASENPADMHPEVDAYLTKRKSEMVVPKQAQAIDAALDAVFTPAPEVAPLEMKVVEGTYGA
jgi:hypothetical protein